MKKLIIKSLQFILYFLLFSVISNTIFLLIIMTTDWDFKKRIETLKFKDPDYDLLIVGSSLALYGIDSDLLTQNGVKSYNMSLVGNSIKTCYVQLDEYLNKYPDKPHYIMLVANAFLERFDQDGIHPVVEFTMKGQKIDSKDIPLSKFGWQGVELFKKAFSKEYRSRYLSSGQIKAISSVPDISENVNNSFNLIKYQEAHWIDKIAKLCKNNKIELILIDIPGLNHTRNSDSIGPYKIVLADGYTSNLYNLSSRSFCPSINPEMDWLKLSHLNSMGAEKVTKEILRIIPLEKSSENSLESKVNY